MKITKLLIVAIFVANIIYSQTHNTDAVVYSGNQKINFYDMSTQQNYTGLVDLGPTPNQIFSYNGNTFVVNSGTYGNNNSIQIFPNSALKNYALNNNLTELQNSSKKIMLEDGGNAYTACGIKDSLVVITLAQTKKLAVLNVNTGIVVSSVTLTDGNPQGSVAVNDSIIAIALADWGDGSGKHVAFYNVNTNMVVKQTEVGLNAVDVIKLNNGNILAYTWGSWFGADNYGKLIVLNNSDFEIKHSLTIPDGGKAEQLVQINDSLVFVRGFDANYATIKGYYNVNSNVYTSITTGFWFDNTIYGKMLDNSLIVKGTNNNSILYSPDGVSYNEFLPFGTTYCAAIKYENDDPVPVELTSFAAIAKNSNVTLSWSTASEVNSNEYIIERELNNSWIEVGTVKAAGTSTELREYTFTDNLVITGKYNYRLKMVDFDGTFEYSNIIEVLVGSPNAFELSQNFPNPFNPTTTIRFSIPNASNVKLTVYNSLGQQINTLIDEYKPAGSYQVNFDGADLASGVYIYRFETNNFSEVRKMTLLK